MDVSVSAAKAVTPDVWQAIHPVTRQKDRALARFFLITMSCLLACLFVTDLLQVAFYRPNVSEI